MEQMISRCGMVCSDCAAFIALKTDDQELREKTAAEWSKMYDAPFTADHINCTGCISEEAPHIGHWSECNINACARNEDAINCGHCAKFKCQQLADFLKMVNDKSVDERLQQIHDNL